MRWTEIHQTFVLKNSNFRTNFDKCQSPRLEPQKNNRRDKFWTNLGFGAFLNAVRGKRVRNLTALSGIDAPYPLTTSICSTPICSTPMAPKPPFAQSSPNSGSFWLSYNQDHGEGGLSLRGVAFMTVLAVLTVLAALESTSPCFCLSYKMQHKEATVAVLTVLARFRLGHGGFSHDGYPP